ncbi:hypothetical protein CcrJ4_gp459 [Caulobacter phage J4]|nr:hypothetical protein CcrJ4_gp459 [Caulobacter phage J4]
MIRENPRFEKTFTVGDMIDLLQAHDRKLPLGIFSPSMGVMFPPQVKAETINTIGFKSEDARGRIGFNLHDPSELKNPMLCAKTVRKLNGPPVKIVLIHAPKEYVG